MADQTITGLLMTAGAGFVGWVVKEVREIAPLKEVVRELKEDGTYTRKRVDDIYNYLLSQKK